MSTNDKLIIRRFLAVICYIFMMVADAFSVYVIYLSIHGGMTYYQGQLTFVPLFIFSYWMSTFFMQLTYGRIRKKRIAPKATRKLLNGLSTLVSVVLLGFWGYIYVTQAMYTPANEQPLPDEIYRPAQSVSEQVEPAEGENEQAEPVEDVEQVE